MSFLAARALIPRWFPELAEAQLAGLELANNEVIVQLTNFEESELDNDGQQVDSKLAVGKAEVEVVSKVGRRTRQSSAWSDNDLATCVFHWLANKQSLRK